MQKSIETRVTLLENEDMHISQALNDHSKRTENSLNEIKNQVSVMVQLQTEIVGISRDLSVMMSKHDKLEVNINKRLKPIEIFINNTKFAYFLIKNTPIITLIALLTGASAYFFSK